MTSASPAPDPERPVVETDEELEDAVDEIDPLPTPDEERPVGPPPGGDDPMAGPAPSG